MTRTAVVKESALGSATVSPDGLYRFRLSRDLPLVLGEAERTCLFVLLHPSKATASVDDPVTLRCMAFAEQIGCSRLDVVNLFAYRTDAPAHLFTAQRAGVDVIGPGNDDHICAAVSTADDVIVAWGSTAPLDRVAQVQNVIGFRELWCLGTNENGSPRHPMYVPPSVTLQLWGGDPR